MAESQPFELDPAALQEIADRLSHAVATRILEVLKEHGFGPQAARQTEWLNALEVARRLGVSREWVYEHAEELGATRLGSGRSPGSVFPSEALLALLPRRHPCLSRLPSLREPQA